MKRTTRALRLLPAIGISLAANLTPLLAAPYACVVDMNGSTYAITCQGGSTCTIVYPSGNVRTIPRASADWVCN